MSYHHSQIQEAVNQYAKEWNAFWAEHHDDYSQDFEVTYYSVTLADSEYTRVVNEELSTLIAAFSLMLIYLALTLGKYSCIGARPYLALSAVIILLGALAIGFSISLCLGFPFNSVIMLVPFVLLGVGMDDMS